MLATLIQQRQHDVALPTAEMTVLKSSADVERVYLPELDFYPGHVQRQD